MLRDWGAERKYEHVLKGFNYRLEELQAAVLRVKLRQLDAWTEARRRAAACYDEHFAGSTVARPEIPNDVRHVHHIYAIRTRYRAEWQSSLANEGIQTGIHYPTPVHLLPAFAELGGQPGQFPHAERAAREVLSLPMFAELTGAQCAQVAQRVLALAELDASRVRSAEPTT